MLLLSLSPLGIMQSKQVHLAWENLLPVPQQEIKEGYYYLCPIDLFVTSPSDILLEGDSDMFISATSCQEIGLRRYSYSKSLDVIPVLD